MRLHRSLGMFLCGPILGFAASFHATFALAGDPGAIPTYAFTPHQNVFIFAGKSVDEDMLNSLNLFGAEYEDNVLVGVGYQRFFYETMQISFGLEGGVAGRFGDKDSAEFWGG